MPRLKLIDSPKLYVTSEITSNLKNNLHSPLLKSMAKRVLHDADGLLESEPLAECAPTSYLGKGRAICSRLENLTCAWILTGDSKYREAAVDHLGGLSCWNHISCEAHIDMPPDADRFFCLSYGEESAVIALMYDQFRPSLTDDEREIFFEVINKHHLKEALTCLERRPWWAGKSWSNWNGVCAGGMGLMALAFYDDIPEARQLVPWVEESLDPYLRSYIANGGGCPEGTGYWNYGMNYAMRYLLSWESATGKKHPAFRIKELGKSLHFPIDFTGITFGDNDGWHPTAFFFMVAKRLNQQDAALNAATHLPNKIGLNGKQRQFFAQSGDLLYAAHAIPTVDEIAKLKRAHNKKKVPLARIYEGMDWAALADDEAFPKLRMSIRGGSSRVDGHGNVDLLSFQCKVGNELMITDQKDTGYLTTTFGPRGPDIYSRGPESKSTLFVEGLGCARDVKCDRTELVKSRGISGVRIDATHVYLPKMPVKFIGRLFLFIENEYWLVIDHVLSRGPDRPMGMESRLHTYAECKVLEDAASLKGRKERMQLTFAALEPSVMQMSRGMPPMARGEQTTIIRWLSGSRAVDSMHVVGLNPGSKRLGLLLEKNRDGTYLITVSKPDGKKRRIRVTFDLCLGNV